MATVNMIAVSKYYQDHCILNNIYLGIEKGEFVAVVGPSGSGKSTLLRLVAGLESISSGQILINDQCVNTLPASKRNMAMVFQSYALYPHMTVFANMAYGLKMRGVNKALIQQRVERVSELLQISDYLHRKPVSLSGGQRQRVAMGRAIVREPAVFLFDEPLSNLDAKLRTEMRYEIKKLHQQLQTTCLYVTHDQTEAMTLADTIVVLNKGQVEQIGPPQVLYQQPASAFVASFIGHYPMNFIPARLEAASQQLITDIGMTFTLSSTSTLITDKMPVMIGIRPEHLMLSSAPSSTTLSGPIEFIDDMGSDKLINLLVGPTKHPLTVRVPGDVPISETHLSVSFMPTKGSVFCQQTGVRIGGLDEKK